VVSVVNGGGAGAPVPTDHPLRIGKALGTVLSLEGVDIKTKLMGFLLYPGVLAAGGQKVWPRLKKALMPVPPLHIPEPTGNGPRGELVGVVYRDAALVL